MRVPSETEATDLEYVQILLRQGTILRKRPEGQTQEALAFLSL